MPAAVIENPNNIARNGKGALNSRSSDLRLRWNHMSRRDAGLTRSSIATRNENGMIITSLSQKAYHSAGGSKTWLQCSDWSPTPIRERVIKSLWDAGLLEGNIESEVWLSEAGQGFLRDLQQEFPGLHYDETSGKVFLPEQAFIRVDKPWKVLPLGADKPTPGGSHIWTGHQ
jgi:hypothetical protein